ncbi:uncharacterized protein TM35_000301990 [Trypanosoma theileri]|uniref:Uncharacterized protein n=1 Tax=Trypanosoma theileri TaxID=67003 RepID=A0A1X0NPQ5_9TRYP|nr:uncharacterized protein TM35_000301990 [Trypanosoma theileri]ORC86159.1 hypothetical protein TM35_000301990 [Trypanosoma theileri]
MNVDNPFADDLSSLDALMAEFAAGKGSRSIGASPAVPTLSTATVTIPTTTNITNTTTNTIPTIAGAPFAGMEGRRGRRNVLPMKDSAQQQQQQQPFATRGTAMPKTTTVVEDEPMPWEIDDEPSPNTREQTPATARSALPKPNPNMRVQQETVAVDDNNNSDDDPLGFLEGPVSSRRTAATGERGNGDVITTADANTVSSSSLQNVKSEEEKRRAEYRDLLSSMDAVEMEITQMQNTLDTLQIKSDTELTEMETKIIEKQMEFAKQEENIMAEQEKYDAHHQRRIQEVRDRTADLLKQQEEVVGAAEKERYKAQLKSLTAEAEEKENIIEELLQQRELLLQNHRYDEKGIFIALEEEEEEKKEKEETIAAATDNNNDEENKSTGEGSVVNGLSSVERKMNAALRILRQHHNERLDSLTNGVVEFIHQETREVAQETRKKREVTYMQDILSRKEELAEFMQEFLQRYRDFFQYRAEEKIRNMTTVREGLQKATAQLRLCAKKRLETRVKDVATKLEESARRFEKLATESFEYVRRKAAAVSDSDETTAQSQRADLENRCQVEQAVLEKLQRAEVETLQEQLERLRRLSERDRSENITHEHDRVKALCIAKAESCTCVVRELESAVQQQTRQQMARNKALRVEGEGHLFLNNEELALRMAVQEKEAAVNTLLEDVRKHQQELFVTRQRCNELHAVILNKLQEEVQTVRQQRLAQESHFASVELLRTAWGREQQELLHWGLEIPQIDDISTTTTNNNSDGGNTVNVESARAHIPIATAVVNTMDLIAERSHSLVEHRTQMREQWRHLHYLMEKEYNNVLAERRETELCWVHLVESLLQLLTEQEAAGAQECEVTQEIAKLEAAKELLNHDKELFCRRRAELEEDTIHLKKELEAILSERAKQTELHQKLAKEQNTLLQQQQRLNVESPGLPYSLVTNNATDNVDNTNNAVTVDDAERYVVSPPQHEKTASHCSVSRLQDETGSDNVLPSSEKQQQRRMEIRRPTLPPNVISNSPITGTYTNSPFRDSTSEIKSNA